jgi:hypothetical protein
MPYAFSSSPFAISYLATGALDAETGIEVCSVCAFAESSVILTRGAGDIISRIFSSPSSARLPALINPNINAMKEQPIRPDRISKSSHISTTTNVYAQYQLYI